MSDLFDNVILCRQCGKEMQKETIVKNGVTLRSAHCEKCHKREFHPLDLAKLREFQELRQRPFRVKLRMVGNSYAVSIPREIIDFFEEADRMFEEVEVKFSDFDKLMLSFHQQRVVHSKTLPKEIKDKVEKYEKVFKNNRELISKENSKESKESKEAKGKNGKSD